MAARPKCFITTRACLVIEIDSVLNVFSYFLLVMHPLYTTCTTIQNMWHTPQNYRSTDSVLQVNGDFLVFHMGFISHKKCCNHLF